MTAPPAVTAVELRSVVAELRDLVMHVRAGGDVPADRDAEHILIRAALCHRPMPPAVAPHHFHDTRLADAWAILGVLQDGGTTGDLVVASTRELAEDGHSTAELAQLLTAIRDMGPSGDTAAAARRVLDAHQRRTTIGHLARLARALRLADRTGVAELAELVKRDLDKL